MNMTSRILIRHVSGARSNQIDEFSAASFREAVAGREDSAAIRFDPMQEDLVSRQHLRISADAGAPGSYLLSDLQSRNGTFLNRQRITQPTRIQHLDTVQLGPGGPEFRFELDPPPPSAAKPTRMAFATEANSLIRPTRESAMPTSSSAPRPIGRATVERMLDDNFGRVRRESNKALWGGLAAAVLLACGIGASWWYMHAAAAANAQRAQQQQALLLQMAQVVRQQPSSDAAVRKQVDQISGELKKVIAENQALRQSAAAAAGADASAAGGQPQADASSDFDAGLNQAMQLYKNGDYAGAYQAAAAIIGIDGSRWEGYYVAGQSLSALNRPADAQTMYQYAMAEAPADVKQALAQRISAATSGNAAGGGDSAQ